MIVLVFQERQTVKEVREIDKKVFLLFYQFQMFIYYNYRDLASDLLAYLIAKSKAGIFS